MNKNDFTEIYNYVLTKMHVEANSDLDNDSEVFINEIIRKATEVSVHAIAEYDRKLHATTNHDDNSSNSLTE